MSSVLLTTDSHIKTFPLLRVALSCMQVASLCLRIRIERFQQKWSFFNETRALNAGADMFHLRNFFHRVQTDEMRISDNILQLSFDIRSFRTGWCLRTVFNAKRTNTNKLCCSISCYWRFTKHLTENCGMLFIPLGSHLFGQHWIVLVWFVWFRRSIGKNDNLQFLHFRQNRHIALLRRMESHQTIRNLKGWSKCTRLRRVHRK